MHSRTWSTFICKVVIFLKGNCVSVCWNHDEVSDVEKAGSFSEVTSRTSGLGHGGVEVEEVGTVVEAVDGSIIVAAPLGHHRHVYKSLSSSFESSLKSSCQVSSQISSLSSSHKSSL